MPNGEGGYRSAEEVARYWGFGSDQPPVNLDTLVDLQGVFLNSELKVDAQTQDTLTQLVATGQLTVQEVQDNFLTDNSPAAVKARYSTDLATMVRGINNNEFEVEDAIGVLEEMGYQGRNIDKDLLENGVIEEKIYRYRLPIVLREFVETREELFDSSSPIKSLGRYGRNIVDVTLTQLQRGGRDWDEFVNKHLGGDRTPRSVKGFISEDMMNRMTRELFTRFPTQNPDDIKDDIKNVFRIIQ
jgi:hypothetical protein